jgi:hypothetical protein
MIDLLKRINDHNLSFSEYFWLLIISENSTWEFKKQDSQVFIDLEVKGYICTIFSNRELTNKGKDILKKINEVEKVGVVKEVNKYDVIHKSLQDTLKRWTNKTQIKGFGGIYFIPTKVELEEFLKRFWKKYPKSTDLEKITKILCKHIETCYKKNSFAPAIKYYIGKSTDDGYTSQLANAYDDFEEKEEQLNINSGDFIL